ncbi:hypothetical protein Bca52824_091263 [Brassica carinata]|uniref:Uncharacterized protein n=1 Tax=Brassica carinata TaxID=52824 RepID=A0A8X7NXY3_BRACI|nr:hypothetical protein Bca52824_091263 [Brassica carinata]
MGSLQLLNNLKSNSVVKPTGKGLMYAEARINDKPTESEAVECRTLDGDSPVAESITSLCSDPSSMGHVESRVNQQGPPCKAKYSWVTDSEVVPGEMPLEPRASWFSPKCVEAQQLTGHLGVKHCFGAGRESGTKSRQTLNTRYDLKITGVKVGQ